MNAYVYNADIYCEPCAAKIKTRLDGHTVEDNGDSENYPQGPYGNGGGEADTPQHCGDCHEFLQNPLTDDGMEYIQANQRDEWDEFYEVTRDEVRRYEAI